MSPHNDGGPAFPAPAGVQHITTQGMTLRDYFAAAALQGIISNDFSFSFSSAAREAYIYADAMLDERKEAQP